MAYEWFKLYAEARVDRKLARLTLAERGVWINLLCFASEQDERGAFDASNRFLLAIECADGDEALLGATLEKLEQTRCVERHDALDGWFRFRTFNKRQESTHTKPSDSPERVAERVHKHREQKRATALQADVTPSNAHVTPSNAIELDTERDTDTDTEREEETPTVGAALSAGETPPLLTVGSAPEARSLGAAPAPADGMASPEPRPEPTAMSASTPASTPAPPAVVMFTLPERLASDTTERTYWERVMKELPSPRRVPLLVHLAHEKIGVDDTPGGAAYARLGQLARKHTASLVAVWIIQASGQDIAGHPLDYLTRLANGQLERQRRTPPLATAARPAGQRSGQRSGQRDNRSISRGVSRDDYFAEVDAESRRLNDEFRRTGVMPGLSPPGKIGATG